MNLLSIAEQLAALDVSPIHVDAERCLHHLDRHSTCARCAESCPTQALSVGQGQPITLNVDACVVCGQCLHDCPVGALTGPDKIAELWTLASRPEDARVLEVACARHPSPEVGPAGTDAVLRVSTCLAALSPSAYIGLLALGFEQIAARLDKCAACPIRAVQDSIGQSIATAQQLLAARQEAGRITTISADRGRGWTRRPVYARNTDLSRRDLFRRFLPKREPPPDRGVQLFDASPGQALDADPTTKQPPRERTRLLNTLRSLPPVDRTALLPLPLRDLPHSTLARMTADDQCSACGACARICPTGALNLAESSQDRYHLTFNTGACVNCGLCLKVCAPDALRREDPTLADLLEPGPLTLRAGTFRQCARCGAKFATVTENTLCPICEFRRQHPFGSQLPPGVRKRRAETSPMRGATSR